jgi:hypothetical protein
MLRGLSRAAIPIIIALTAATPVRAEAERADGGRASGERSGGERSSESHGSRGGWGESGGTSGSSAPAGTASGATGGSAGGTSGGAAAGPGSGGATGVASRDGGRDMAVSVPGPGRVLAEQDIARDAVARGAIVPFDRVIPTVGRAVPGDLLDARLRSRGPGSWSYEVLVLSKAGDLRQVHVDAVRNVVIEVRRR